MAGINKNMLKEFASEGFFDQPRKIEEVVAKIDNRGYTLKGKQVSLLSQLLTFLCREGILEREKNEQGEWRYKKRQK
ncbi:hypothetical protein J4433_00850 [Candidatus Pacearchaeota archaeon]|nr:hypothetical protein [Candidatus Pacearchaeota archaeon]